MHPFDPLTNFSATGIVGSSIPVALGYAYALCNARERRRSRSGNRRWRCQCGCVHECLNIAGAWSLPLVLLSENNAWAISVPAAAVTAPPSLVRRADAYGALGIAVDGGDVEEVERQFGLAMAHARGGRGPVVIEASCHRLRGHYEGDADS